MANIIFNSITNKNSIVSEIKDTINPYSFIEYISKTSGDNTTEDFKNYKEYLVEWSNIRSTDDSAIDSKTLLQREIINLLKIITVSYATFEEQSFLASLNWDMSTATAEEKNSLYSALPIFVSRLKEIADFYRKKRSEANFIIERNKIKGTTLSIEKIIFDKIIQYLFNNDQSQIPFVQNFLNISIDNYVDVYSDYFDIERGVVPTANYNDIDKDIYFELKKVLGDMLFDGNVYLREIPLIAQLAIDFSQECIGDKLTLKNELVEKSELSLITDTDKIALRKKLYQKFIGTDFYYLYKDSEGNIVTDVFIKADNPTNNLLNQQTIDTPTNPGNQLKLLKNIGLFFKPCKTSLLRVNTYNFDYVIDESKIKDNKVYIFPDPKVYGNVGFNKQSEYPYIIEYSFDDYIKNFGYGVAEGDPEVSEAQQPVFSYYSKEQDIQKVNKNNKITLDFESLYNKGYITTLKSDFYGNKFALYKEENGKFARDMVPEFEPFTPGIKKDKLFITIDGGVLGSDDTGWAEQTSADLPSWNAGQPHYYNFFFEAGISELIGTGKVPMRAYFPDSIPPGNGNFELSLSGNVNEGVGFVDGGKLDEDYTQYEPYVNEGSSVLVNKYRSELVELPEVSNTGTYYDIEYKQGELFVSLGYDQQVLPIQDVLTWWANEKDNNYNNYQYFLANLYEFDIVENVIILKAKDKIDGKISLLFEKLNYSISENKFVKAEETPIIFRSTDTNGNVNQFESFSIRTFSDFDSSYYGGNSNITDRGSNIFYVEGKHKCYFAVMQIKSLTFYIENIPVLCPVLYPDVYEIDLNQFNYKAYKFNFADEEVTKQVTESFRIPDTLFGLSAIAPHKLGNVCLSYSNVTDMFMLSYISYDLNMCPYVYKHFFTVNGGTSIYNGEIDTLALESTIYHPVTTDAGDVINPGDEESLRLTFDNNKIID